MPATPEQRHALIKQLHAAPLQLVLQVTGGGSLAISDLLTIPGGSRILLAAGVPYSEAALQELLGKAPEQACSEPTARQMAMAAWSQARQFATNADAVTIGLGCTASLASDRPKRGDHRIHLAIQTTRETRTWSLTLSKDQRSRGDEEQLASNAILNLLAANAGLSAEACLKLPLLDQEAPQEQSCAAPESWQPLLEPKPYAVNGSGSLLSLPKRVGQTIFPGSFAPLHDGHRQIAAIAAERVGRPVVFEIAARNVDKPPLDYIELRNRMAQFDVPASVWLTTTPTFVEKGQLFPRATFVVGVDTITRIADPRYYGDDAEQCNAAIQTIAAAGCRFLVFGRVNGAGVFETLADCELPAELRVLCEEIPEADFRRDVSSTELRKRAQ